MCINKNILITLKFLCFFLILFSISCQNESRWYPSAGVSINNHYEYTDISGVKLTVTLVVHNTGDTSILSSAITVKAVTNKREYLQTAAFESKIIPGGKIALTVTISYLEPDESLAPDGLSIYSSFFD